LWPPKIIKVDFEAAVISAINEVSVTAGCNFHFGQCLCKQLQNIGPTLEYKEIDQV
jgi:hypothetical protein